MSPLRGERVVLRDGSAVRIDPVRPSDAPLLAEGFARLSDESRRLRFLMDKTRLTAAELRYLTDVDHHDHEAIIALDERDGRGLGIARYVRDSEEPETAEIAVTVADDWQSRGLGTELLHRLTDRAAQEGIRRFTALVAADNAAVDGLLHAVGGDLRVLRRDTDFIEYEITPTPQETRAGLHALLRAFARREITPPERIGQLLAALVPGRFSGHQG